MKEKNKDIYDVEMLRDIYKKNVDYLAAKAKLDSSSKNIQAEVEKFQLQVRKEVGIDALEKKQEELRDALYEYDKIKKDEYNDDYDEFYKFTDNQIIDYFEKSKELVLLSRKIAKLEEQIIDRIYDFEATQDKLKTAEKKQLVDDVVKKALELFHNSVFNKKHFDMQTITEMFIENNFGSQIVRCNGKDYFSAYEFKKGMLAYLWLDKLNNDKHEYRYLTNKKISKKFLSGLEYFQKKLGEYAHEKCVVVHLITNETGCSTDHYEPDEYYTKGYTLIVPESVANELLKNEKNLDNEKIHKTLEKNTNTLLLNERCIKYFTNYSFSFNIPKFDEKVREECRRQLKNDIDSNCIDITKMFFGRFEEDYADGEQIVSPQLRKNIAKAMFDSLEYMNKLLKVKKIEQYLKNKEQLDDSKTAYEELVKSL